MNRSAAVARDLAEFFIAKRVRTPTKLTYDEYLALGPPYTIRRVQIYFNTFARGMAIAERHMAQLKARVDPTEVVVRRSTTTKTKPVVVPAKEEASE